MGYIGHVKPIYTMNANYLENGYRNISVACFKILYYNTLKDWDTSPEVSVVILNNIAENGSISG